MPRALRPVRAALLLFASALIAALVLASCDTATSPGEEASPDAASEGRLRVVERLPGGALMGEDGDPAEASPYTCRISTLRSEEAVAAGEAPYGYHTIYLHFPPGLERMAEGETQRNAFVFGHTEAPAYAEEIAGVLPPGAEAEGRRGTRMARCLLPGGPKHEQLSRRARKMVEKHLRKFPDDSWVVQHANEGGEAAPAQGQPSGSSGFSTLNDGGGCDNRIYVIYTQTTRENGVIVDQWSVVLYSYCAGGGGGGGGGGGDGNDLDPDPCESDDPPPYCDEIGSCFDKNLSKLTQQQKGMILALEGSGTLNTLWQGSNYDPNDMPGGYIGDRREKFGVVKPDEFSSGYRAYPLPENSYESTPTRAYVSPSLIPDDAVAVIHTHPFSSVNGGDWIPSREEHYKGTVSETLDIPSLDAYGVEQGIMIDAEGIVFFDETSNEYGTRVPRCGF